ncbi:ATP-binding cassette domain-containing protein [Mucilaginibacter sp. CSA2-8R]|uniref:ATP-binding cassette domain-containing protein n=1 Tax=Mucilaginibacter sp. CSA2-8R TaxID=3141542 RepID=UPI00315DB597
MALLEVKDATLRMQQHTLLHNLNITINQGEHWLITGSSGSGKTILLNVFAGLLKPVSGLVTTGIDQKHLGKGILLVTAKHHFKDTTNTSNLYYQQRYNSQDADQTVTVLQYLQSKTIETTGFWTVDRVINLLMLNKLADKSLIKLSNGETKRLRLASALLAHPAILLLDDPLAGLDYDTQQHFGSLLRKIISSGITIIMAGSGFEIPSVITHVAIMEQGTVTQTLPASQFTPPQQRNTSAASLNLLSELLKNNKTTSYSQMVNMENVNIRYGDVNVLTDVNWTVKPGDRWALFGHNGAGKSSLLSLINGDNPQAYANHIILFDRKRGSGESIWEIKRKIGFLSPEFYQYFPTDQSALQVVESGYYDTQGLFRPSQPAKAEKAMDWLKALQIEQYARHRLKNMPASAQRLCLLARALIKLPDLLILDEPCQGLDKQQRVHFNQLIDAIVEQTGLTLIYVTHYIHELPDSINKVITLQEGRIHSIQEK